MQLQSIISCIFSLTQMIIILFPSEVVLLYVLWFVYESSIKILFFLAVAMASPDSWMREFNDASKLADEINGMISGRSSLPVSPSGPETQRHMSATRRKVTILRTKLETLHSLLSKLPTKQKESMWVIFEFTYTICPPALIQKKDVVSSGIKYSIPNFIGNLRVVQF